jgi:hypothetical protein
VFKERDESTIQALHSSSTSDNKRDMALEVTKEKLNYYEILYFISRLGVINHEVIQLELFSCPSLYVLF